MAILKKSPVSRAFHCAFPYTIPIFAGFWFLGITYGIYMRASGFSFWYPLWMSLTIFGGSLEFLAAAMLSGPFSPLQALFVTLLVQARHLFYGLAMLEKFKGMGWKKVYLIFGMCDESFSINFSAEIPEDTDKGWFMLFVTLLNQLYWVSGAALGSLLGSLITINLEGLDFVMTALFTVILTEQWMKEKNHLTAVTGITASAFCLFIFGSGSFLLPAMACILLLLTLLRKPVMKGGGPA